jgi:hypothetical protein
MQRRSDPEITLQRRSSLQLVMVAFLTSDGRDGERGKADTRQLGVLSEFREKATTCIRRYERVTGLPFFRCCWPLDVS